MWRPRCAGGGGLGPAPMPDRWKEPVALEEVAEAVTEGDLRDLAYPLEVADAGEQTWVSWRGRGHYAPLRCRPFWARRPQGSSRLLLRPQPPSPKRRPAEGLPAGRCDARVGGRAAPGLRARAWWSHRSRAARLEVRNRRVLTTDLASSRLRVTSRSTISRPSSPLSSPRRTNSSTSSWTRSLVKAAAPTPIKKVRSIKSRILCPLLRASVPLESASSNMASSSGRDLCTRSLPRRSLRALTFLRLLRNPRLLRLDPGASARRSLGHAAADGADVAATAGPSISIGAASSATYATPDAPAPARARRLRYRGSRSFHRTTSGDATKNDE